MPRFLLIDNSNTRTKFAVGSPAGVEAQVERAPTEDLSADLVADLIARFEFDAAVVSSVVPEKAALLRDALRSRPLHEISHRSVLPIGIDYPAPEQIGADRLANSVAVHARFGAPSIVVDFGTAVTFDVVGTARNSGSSERALPRRSRSSKSETQTGAYLGGVIAPGLAAMTEYLHRRTALLPRIDLAEPESAIGKSTIEAMRAGAVFGYRGLIREILLSVRRELDAEPAVVATGGDAALIAEGLPEVREVIPNLTLEGIRLIGEANLG